MPSTPVGLHQADFTSSPSLAFLIVLTFGVWQFFGEGVILYLAALKTMPLDLSKRPASTAPAPGGASGTSAGRSCAGTPSSSAWSPP